MSREVHPGWRASSDASYQDESILEVRRFGHMVEMRDRHRRLAGHMGVLFVEVEAFQKFLEAAKRGEFDDIADPNNQGHKALADAAHEAIRALRYGGGIDGIQGSRWISGPC